MALGDTIASLTTGYGTIKYDGVAFNALRNYSLRCEPIWDEADRTITHQRYTLHVHGWIMSSDVSTQNSTMDSLQDVLTRPGRKLELSGLGLDSDIATNFQTGNHLQDVNWGAKPRLLELKPAGGLIAWEFDWEVEFSVYREPTGQNPLGTSLISAFNYTAAYAIDEEGLTTRTMEGYFETPFPQYDPPKRTIAYNPLEIIWQRANFTLPFGFKRLNISRRLSADRRRMNFVVVDQEFPDTAYPQGIVKADVRHEFANEPPGFIRWHSVLSGTLTVAKGLPKSLAAQKFFLILADVAAKARTVAHASDIGGTVIPVRIKFAVEKFGRTSEFFVAFTMAACLEEILTKSGIWEPVKDTDWVKWSASMRNLGIGTQFGVARLAHLAGDDRIVDLADARAVISIGNESRFSRDESKQVTNQPLCPQPTKRNSYMHFANRIQAVEQSNTVVHRAAQPSPPMRLVPEQDGMGGPVTLVLSPEPSGSVKPHTVQYTGSEDQLFLMYGDAVRMKWTPQIPELKSIGGVPVEKLAQNIDIGPVAAFFDCPMYTGRWTILYRVKGYAPTMKAPRNKFLCVKEGADDGIKS